MFGDERGRFGDLAELIRGEVVPLDIIKCNDRYAVNICSMGLDARVGTDVHKYSRFPLIGGAGGYVVSLAANYIKGVKTAMTAHVEGMTCGPELNIVCVCNGRYYGGGFNPTNDARPDDGLMDGLSPPASAAPSCSASSPATPRPNTSSIRSTLPACARAASR